VVVVVWWSGGLVDFYETTFILHVAPTTTMAIYFIPLIPDFMDVADAF
jgi:hypothetical protein